MSMREELITQALQNRLNELCKTRAPQLVPEKFSDAADFVSRVREQLINASTQNRRREESPSVWMDSEMDCLSSLRALSLGETLQLGEGKYSPADSFIHELDNYRRDPVRRFQLLAERYRCPLNLALPAEDEIREYVLARLMVQDRAIIESQSDTKIDADDLLLKLSLIAALAQATSDLRFLDALNYYYELLPVNWHPESQHAWLLVSWLALYACALISWL